MCGIIGYTGSKPAQPFLIEGLKKLEYRGYDSAGIALYSSKDFQIFRAVGPVAELENQLSSSPSTATQGIAHTRWATHGGPSEINAHPHRSGELVLVHNGIIENHIALKEVLSKKGFQFVSQTDSEVLAAWIEHQRAQLSGSHWKNLPLAEKRQIAIEAIKQALEHIEGHYAFVAMFRDLEDHIFGAQMGAPMVIAPTEHGFFVASDLQATLQHSLKAFILPKNSIFWLDSKTSFWNPIHAPKSAPFRPSAYETLEWSAEKVEKDGYETFMLKEIFQQPIVVADSLSGRLPEAETQGFHWDHLKAHEVLWKNVKRLYLIACGTSYHAALVAKYFFERWSRLDCHVDIASEFRYRSPVFEPGTVVGVISQSGETADTLAALRLANEAGCSTFSICNVPTSTIARESSFQYPTKAGPEIGVASTKAFTAQLTVLSALALDVARLRGVGQTEAFHALARLPHDLDRVLTHAEKYIQAGKSMAQSRLVLFIGRGPLYPLALEGALKLKELTYVPAEGFAAGELKHGPIAYIDDQVTTIVLAPQDDLYLKTVSNLQEVKARGGKIIAIGTEGDRELAGQCHDFFGLPQTNDAITPMIMAIPLQLMAYGMALALGRNIDKPRNLAKSVTVE